MLVTFSSKAGADILMLSQHAAPLLRIMGKLNGTELPLRGVFMPEHMAQTIQLLEVAVNAAPAPSEDHEASPDAFSRPVGLRQRAFPLLDLLKRAKEKNLPVLWQTGSAW